MGYYLIFLTLLPLAAMASPAEEPVERSIPILETTQDLLGGRVNTVANRLDLFFADQRADDELARSRIRLRQNFEVRERAKLTKQTQIRVNIRLPNLEEKFKFKFQKDEVDSEEEKKKLLIKEAKKDALVNELNTKWQFRADVGVNASIPPKVFFRNRLRKNWQTGDVIHRFVEEVSWFSDRDWEQNTGIDSDITFNDDTLFRFVNSSDWKITRKDFTTSHGPTVRHRISADDGLSYGIGMTTIVENGVWYVNNYRISVTYRRNLYKQWLYADLTSGLDFPKIWSFRRTPFIALQLEALFGGH